MTGSTFDRVLSRFSILVAGVSVGAMAVWLLSQRNGRIAKRRGTDLGLLEGALAQIPECRGVRLRDLGGGIIEAFGSAPDAEAASRATAVLRELCGSGYVVNRIWTPTSRERRGDLSPASRPRPQAEA
jgi:hypothetical protein